MKRSFNVYAFNCKVIVRLLEKKKTFSSDCAREKETKEESMEERKKYFIMTIQETK